MRYFACLLFIIYFLTSSTALAVSNNFSVKAFVGIDTEPPTTPVLISAVPVAPTQINVDWGASTDNVFLAGYRLFRDGLQIATTTLTSFNDTGLTPSTTYVYSVDAFDTFENFSSSSLSVATTTPNIPVVLPPIISTPTSTPTKTGTVFPLLVDTVQVIPSKNSAQIIWSTKFQTRFDLSWGRTESYELGTISSNEFRLDHQTVVTDLEPGTTYLYRLRAINSFGISKVISEGSFTTTTLFPVFSPPNVSNFSYQVDNNNVYLKWQNNDLPDNYLIRIVRSYLFYPLNTQDGAVVYEGVGTSFNDYNALASISPQYYTAFVYSPSGLVSSGAIVRVDKTFGGENKIPINPDTDSGIKLDTATTSTEGVNPGASNDELQFEDVMIIQGSTSQFLSNDLRLRTKLPFSVVVPAAKISKNVKSIVVSIQDPSNNKILNSYILKLNSKRTAYEAVLAPTTVSGVAKLYLGLFDFSDKRNQTLFGSVVFFDEVVSEVLFPDKILSISTQVAVALLVCGLLAWVYWLLILLRKRKSEDN